MADFDMDSNEHKNWMKTVIAQKVVRGGLEQFVIDGLKKVQSKVGLSCGRCKSEDVAKGCACPGCVGVMKNLKAMHFFGKPTFKNMSTGVWTISPLEIGKLFLPTEGYRHLITFDDVDLNGLINILLNCVHFSKGFTFTPQPSGTNCLLSKLRQIGRNVRHTSTHKVSDSELHDNLNTMITLLSDQQQLSGDQHAMEAVRKLNKLQTDQISLYLVSAVEKWKKMYDAHYIGSETETWSVLEDALCCKSSLVPFDELELESRLRESAVKKSMIRVVVTNPENVRIKCHTDVSVIVVNNDPKQSSRIADKIALHWAFRHCNGATSIDSIPIQKYKYLFRVSLTNSDQCDILQLIYEQIVSDTYVEQDRENAIQYIRQVLEKETCCVLVDGTAEWKKRHVNAPLPCLPSGWESTLVIVQ